MNILVVRNDKLGDFITALPTCKVLKSAGHRVSVLVAPLNEELARRCGFIDEVIVDRGESVFTLAKKLRSHKFDLSLTLFSNTRVALAQLLALIPKRYAPATKIAQIFYTHRIKQRRSEVKMAEFEYNLALAKSAFADLSLTYPQPLCVFEDAKEVYEDFCKTYSITKEVIAFHVGFGGSSDANYSLDEYVEMIESVLDGNKYQVVCTFGPDEEALAKTMQEKLKNKDVIFYISREGLVHFAKIISGFRLFVSTSTGTYHLASLVGTPTLTFFADTLFASSKRWKSVGDEKLQKHFMLPEDKAKREEILEEVKNLLSKSKFL
ncbi:MAG: glycosyltransferase family 9 protein [Epsilonproteobacteria bacterium]|nr:glycosyltransferase family 9 protein [Campylobacterota bacterium]